MQPKRVQTPYRQTFDNNHLLRYVEKRSNLGRATGAYAEATAGKRKSLKWPNAWVS